jgi:hypothetical protein
MLAPAAVAVAMASRAWVVKRAAVVRSCRSIAASRAATITLTVFAGSAHTGS